MDSNEEVVYIGFNQNATCIVLSTQKASNDTSSPGFRVISTKPLRTCYQRLFPGSFGIVEILYRSNIVALVGGGKNERYPNSTLIIWDDHRLRPIGEIKFTSEIKSVKLSKQHIVVVLETKIYMYNLKDLRIFDIINTFSNPRGLCSLSSKDTEKLACLDTTIGKIQIKTFHETSNTVIRIEAHDSCIACLALNNDANLLATASGKGTLVRIFLVETGELIQELRRGIDRADIYSLAFDPISEWIACTSSNGTVHIYSIDPAIKNRKIELSIFKKVLPKYFESEWSYAQYKVKGAKTICAFCENESKIMIVTDAAMYYEVYFAEGGNLTEETVVNLLELELI